MLNEEINKKARELVRKTLLERYGVENAVRIPGVMEKIYNSKKCHHTFASSKGEEEYYAELLKTYSSDSIER